MNFEQEQFISGRFKTPNEISERPPLQVCRRRANRRSKTHDKSVFYYFCRWHLRGRDPWYAKPAQEEDFSTGEARQEAERTDTATICIRGCKEGEKRSTLSR